MDTARERAHRAAAGAHNETRAPGSDKLDRLQRLLELKERGVLTNDEYDAQKSRLL